VRRLASATDPGGADPEGPEDDRNPVAAGAEASSPGKAPEADPAPPPTWLVEFRGVMTTATGKLVALVKARDAAGAKETLAFLPKGARTGQGLRIRDFSRDTLWIVDPNGHDRKIAFGSTETIVLD